MPYANPGVLQGMFNATRNRVNPLDAGRARHQQTIENQFKNRQIQAQEQNADTSTKELQRRMFQDIHEMGKAKREETRKKLELDTSEMLYAKEQGPEEWDRLMQKKGKQVPFDQADRVISPGVGMGNAFDMYQKMEARAAAQKLEETKQAGATKREKLKQKPSGGAERLKSADSGRIGNIIAGAMGGDYDVTTGQYIIKDTKQRQMVLAIHDRAERIFQSNPGLGHAEAVKRAVKEFGLPTTVPNPQPEKAPQAVRTYDPETHKLR